MSRINLALSMVIFGTIGVFVKYIPLPSSAIALLRAGIGFLFLTLFIIISGRKISIANIIRNLKFLIPAGVFLGVNWILLFESYRHTTVATATLCYYLAPTFIIIASPFVLKERLTLTKGICAFISLVGMVFVSGILTNKSFELSELKGIALGVGAAALYAAIVLLNKKMSDIESFDVTAFQLLASAIVLLPYVLLTEDFSSTILTTKHWILIIFIGIVHTGLAYLLYFGAVKKVSAGAAACFSYIDPVLAVILSAVLLGEPFFVSSSIGAVLILGAGIIGETRKQ